MSDAGRSTGVPGTFGAINLPDFFTAIHEQLGLKLVPTKAPVDVLVIDRVEMPRENFAPGAGYHRGMYRK